MSCINGLRKVIKTLDILKDQYVYYSHDSNNIRTPNLLFSFSIFPIISHKKNIRFDGICSLQRYLKKLCEVTFITLLYHNMTYLLNMFC